VLVTPIIGSIAIRPAERVIELGFGQVAGQPPQLASPGDFHFMLVYPRFHQEPSLRLLLGVA